MDLFKFLKKKELAEINKLQELNNSLIKSIERYKSSNSDLLNKISILSDRLLLLERRYSNLIDLDSEIENKKKDIKTLNEKITRLKSLYSDGFKTYQNLRKDSILYRDELKLINCGVYEPHFNFNDLDSYKKEITEVRNQQKNLIKHSKALSVPNNISLNGNILYTSFFIMREKELILRAFNGEANNFIAAVSWNNILIMEERLQKTFSYLNDNILGIKICNEYYELKLKELRLAYETKLKKYQEKEEQRVIREQMREEAKARREIDAALAKAKKDEELYQKALSKAREEIGFAQGDKFNKLQARIGELEARVAEAEKNKERALSMAQQTKRGHVYVISNIGSFGENIYKIGMTRRLDPMDRVRELGDASVPFPFDVHAIIFSEDAPSLENNLHKAFENRRVNLVNPRKEFFNVTLDEIKEVVHKNNALIEFTSIAEARDFRESNSIKNKEKNNDDTIYKESLFC